MGREEWVGVDQHDDCACFSSLGRSHETWRNVGFFRLPVPLLEVLSVSVSLQSRHEGIGIVASNTSFSLPFVVATRAFDCLNSHVSGDNFKHPRVCNQSGMPYKSVVFGNRMASDWEH